MLKNGDNMDMSIVMVACHEGRRMHPTLMSVFRSKAFAVAHDISSEIVIVLDQPDDNTLRYLDRYRTAPEIRIAETGPGDYGLSRNLGISLASGRYVSVLDSHDLICLNWIISSVTLLMNCREPVIAHPEYLIEFDGGHKIRHLLNSTDPSFPITDMMVDYVYGASLCSAEKSLFIKHPYPPADKASGFGFTDWHFACETLAHDVTHQTVPETVAFIRKRMQVFPPVNPNRHPVMKPTRLFDHNKWNEVIDKIRTKTNAQ